jgi:flavin reductase (DIM6/NTAB) family NADH-FMN oxidoreductase RutF
MKKSIDANTIIHPHPVLIVGSYGPDGRPNLMNAAWGGICCSEPPCVAVSLRKATQTYHNILQHKAFTIGIPSEKQLEIADFVGMASGRDTDKFAVTGLTPVRSQNVDAPFAQEFPFSLECRLVHVHELGLHTQFVGEIVDIQADERILSEKGLPDIEKVRPLLYGSFGSSNYYGIGQRLGKAFSAGKSLKKT